MSMQNQGRVRGKTAVVTGGATGIGRSIVDLLARHEARVAVFDVNEAAGTDLVNVLNAEGLVTSYHQVDVTNEQSVRSAFADVEQRFGALHILVNNAGVSGPSEAPDQVDYTQWQRMFAVNVAGPFLCTKHAIPLMRLSEGGKSIIDISSIYGLVGNADSPSYHSAKGAVRMMAKTDAMVYASEGIRVNAVCPGSILTPLNLSKGEEDPGYLDAMRAKHPLGFIGDPEDIAYGVLYLASDEAKFVTGTELVIDGGYTAQ